MKHDTVANSVRDLKRKAAEHAVTYLRSGMVVGLGHGSTTAYAIKVIGDLLREGTVADVVGIPASRQVELEAETAGVPLTTLDAHPVCDITIDGADEVDPDLNLIKGGGGALLREKIIAQATERELIIVDESKLSSALGTKHALPVEVVRFGWRVQAGFIEGLGGRPVLRLNDDGTPFTTDQGNLILDCDFGPIDDLQSISEQLASRAGIVEHGLFIGLTSALILADRDGVRVVRRGETHWA